MTRYSSTLSSGPNKRLTAKRIKKNREIVLMLVSSNILFFSLSLPYCIFNNFNPTKIKDEMYQSTLVIVHSLAYTNNAFGFLFYALFCDKYREKMKALLFKMVCKKAKKSSDKRAKETTAIKSTHLRAIRTSQSSFSNSAYPKIWLESMVWMWTWIEMKIKIKINKIRHKKKHWKKWLKKTSNLNFKSAYK